MNFFQILDPDPDPPQKSTQKGLHSTQKYVSQLYCPFNRNWAHCQKSNLGNSISYRMTAPFFANVDMLTQLIHFLSDSLVFVSERAICSFVMSDLSQLPMVALLSWATWGNLSWSFVKSSRSESLRSLFEKRVNEQRATEAIHSSWA